MSTLEKLAAFGFLKPKTLNKAFSAMDSAKIKHIQSHLAPVKQQAQTTFMDVGQKLSHIGNAQAGNVSTMTKNLKAPSITKPVTTQLVTKMASVQSSTFQAYMDLYGQD